MSGESGGDLPGVDIPGEDFLFPGAAEESAAVCGEGEAGTGGGEAAVERGFDVCILCAVRKRGG